MKKKSSSVLALLGKEFTLPKDAIIHREGKQALAGNEAFVLVAVDQDNIATLWKTDKSYKAWLKFGKNSPKFNKNVLLADISSLAGSEATGRVYDEHNDSLTIQIIRHPRII